MLSQFWQFGKTGQLDECASKVKGVAGFKTSHSRAGCHLPYINLPRLPNLLKIRAAVLVGQGAAG